MAQAGTHIEFLNYPVLHGVESQKAGREVYVEKPHVRIRVAGNDKEAFFGPVTEQIKRDYPAEWQAFQQGHDAPAVGTPLERWPQLTPERVANLKGIGFRTVEDVAAAADFAVQKIGMGGYKLRDDARKFLSLAQAAADVAQLDELREQVKAKDAETEALKRQMAEMQEQMAALLKTQAKEEPAPRKRKAAAE